MKERDILKTLLESGKLERATRRIQFTTPFYEFRLEPEDGYFAYLYIPERTLNKLKEVKKCQSTK
jgi:hypothetical protein